MYKNIKIKRMEEEESNPPEILDDSWIKEFKETDELYEQYYLDDLDFVKIYFVYVDSSLNIENIQDETFFFIEKNKMKKEELMSIIKNNNINRGKKYGILNILKYNVEINPLDIPSYISNNANCVDDAIKYNFLHDLKKIDDIEFQKTIPIFQDLNNLIILFLEKHKSQNKTKKRNDGMHTKTRKRVLSSPATTDTHSITP
jgi:hypothetical protein